MFRSIYIYLELIKTTIFSGVNKGYYVVTNVFVENVLARKWKTYLIESNY